MRKLILSAVLASASLLGLSSALAQPSQSLDIEAGRQYTELSRPVPVAQPGKIEVVELFWYGCPHCYQFEPSINAWAEKLPSDVHFLRIPAMFGGLWNVHGQLFLTLESMGVKPEVHAAIFNAIHNEHKRLATPDEMADFLAARGIDREDFLKAYNSFAVKSQMEKAKKLALAYRISGVPVMIVNGKYRFDLGTAGGPKGTLAVADYLIAKERSPQ